MTFYLAFEQLAHGRLELTDTITVSPHAAAQPRTNLGMHAGEKITVAERLLGMATHSANDMAVAVAEKIAGTQADFAEMMNRKAQELGMRNSHFVNPHGLPDGRQISTAHDIAVLCRAIQHDFPQYYAIFDTRSFTYHRRTMRNTNHLLGAVPGVDGIKTGFTNAAGHNIAISGVRNGARLIIVVLGAPSGPSRDLTAENLLASGFEALVHESRGARSALAQAQPASAPALQQAAPVQIAEGDADDEQGAPEAKAETRPAELAAARASRWTVQVGVFEARLQARRYLALVEHRWGRQLRGARPQVVGRGHGPFRAQFASLSERQAKSVCEALSANGRKCFRTSTGA